MSRFSGKLSEEDKLAIDASESVVTRLAERTKRVKRNCYKRSIGDFLSAFSMGFFGGATLHFLKTVYFSPPGPERWISGVRAAIKHSPRMGVAFGMWGGIFSVCECLFKRVRGKKDASVTITAGAATGMILAIRHGPIGMMRGGLIGGILLGFIEGIVGLIHLASGGDDEKEVKEVKLGEVSKKDFAEGMLYYKFWRETVDTYASDTDDELVSLARLTRRRYDRQSKDAKASMAARALADEREREAAANLDSIYRGSGVVGMSGGLTNSEGVTADPVRGVAQSEWFNNLEHSIRGTTVSRRRDALNTSKDMNELAGGTEGKSLPTINAHEIDIFVEAKERERKELAEKNAALGLGNAKPWDETFAGWFSKVRNVFSGDEQAAAQAKAAAARAAWANDELLRQYAQSEGGNASIGMLGSGEDDETPEQALLVQQIRNTAKGASASQRRAVEEQIEQIKEAHRRQREAAYAAEGGDAAYLHETEGGGASSLGGSVYGNSDYKLHQVAAAGYAASKIELERERLAGLELERMRAIALERDRIARHSAGVAEAEEVGLPGKKSTSTWW